MSGLPRSAINITLDGMSMQDNYLKTTDGYFARLSPLLDSVEEVTVTTAGNTADATGQGAVQIRFVTKSGTNNWTGTAYEYLRHDALNANTWFRNRDLPPDPETGKAPKDKLRSYQQGVRAGRPDHQEQGVLLLQLRRAALAGREHAAARDPDAGRGVRHLQLQRGRRRAERQPAADCGGQRTARYAGNWKMYKTVAEAVALVEEIKEGVAGAAARRARGAALHRARCRGRGAPRAAPSPSPPRTCTSRRRAPSPARSRR